MTERMVDGPAGKLHVLDQGRGVPTLVFLHSSVGCTDHWHAQLEALGADYRVVAPDLRSHGESDPPGDGDYSVPGMAGDVAAVLDALELPPVVLIGHSMGGAVAAEYAGAHPGRVLGLFLLDPAPVGPLVPGAVKTQTTEAMSRDYAGTVDAYFRSIAGDEPAVQARLLDDLRAAPPEAVTGEMLGAFAYDPRPALGRYPGPVFCLAALSTQSPASVQEALPNLPHRVVQGTGHWIALEQPELVTDAIRQFVANLP